MPGVVASLTMVDGSTGPFAGRRILAASARSTRRGPIISDPARPLKLVIAGGGTGGHVLPAVAVVEELRRRSIDLSPLWIGSENGVERERAADAEIPFHAVPTGKFRRYIDPKTIRDACRVPIGIVASYRILRAFQPDVVFSTGGFVSVPTVIAAARISPILTHEQTTILGMATRIDLRFADTIALSYERTRSTVTNARARVVVTGNPTRASLLEGSAGRACARFGLVDELPLVFVTGGARGSQPINQRIEATLPSLLEACSILHQTGPASANDDFVRLLAVRNQLPDRLKRRYQVVDVVGDEIGDIYAAVDLVVCRAGAGTVAELALLGKPAVLIPLPLSGGGEQAVNAAMLGEAGAAVVLDQAEATPERLAGEIHALLRDARRRESIGVAARAFGRPDAASAIADELLRLIRRRAD